MTQEEMLAEKLAQSLDYRGVSKSKVLTVKTGNGSNMVKAIRIARDLERDTQERETQGLQHEEADNVDEDKEDQNDHDSELGADENDNEKDYDGSVVIM
jgi:hypothetical protein